MFGFGILNSMLRAKTMRQTRTVTEEQIDDMILLTLWSEFQKSRGDSSVGSRLELQKQAFLLAYPLFCNRVKALNLNFYRYNRGPISNEVYRAWERLEKCGLIEEKEQFEVTARGIRLANDFRAGVLCVGKNQFLWDEILGVVAGFSSKSVSQLLECVYSMECADAHTGEIRSIKDTPQSTTLTLALEPEEARFTIDVSPGWEMTLDLMLNPDALTGLEAAISDVDEGRLYSMDTLWNGV